MNHEITYQNFMFAHAATNNNAGYSDLEFIVNGEKIFFHNIPAPSNWDGESDWTENETYIMEMVKKALDNNF